MDRKDALFLVVVGVTYLAGAVWYVSGSPAVGLATFALIPTMLGHRLSNR